MPKDTPRVFIESLGAYNEGRSVGEWVDVTGDPQDLWDAIERILEKGGNPGGDWAIHDYEGFGKLNLGENPDIEAISKYAELLEEHGDAFLAFLSLDAGYSDVEDIEENFQERYAGEWKSPTDWAENFLEDTGGPTPEQAEMYLDWEMLARDMEIEADEEDSENVEQNYDGDWEKYAQELVDDVGGAEALLGKNLHLYFDYEAFARDAEMGGDITFVEESYNLTYAFYNN